MMKHCKNCGSTLHGHYCSNCGQRAKVERLTFSYIAEEVFQFFTHIKRGFLFTSWSMLSSPGKTITDFIAGKRKNYQPPVSYFLIWTAVFIVSLFFLEKVFGEGSVIAYHDYFGQGESTRFAVSNLNIVLTGMIPLLAIYFFLFIGGRQFNYIESLVAAAYFIGTILLLQFIFALCALMYFSFAGSPVALQLSDVFKAGYITWATIDTIRLLPVKNKFLRGVLFFAFSLGTFTLWRLVLYPAVASLFMND
jgi:hypothetical protein